MGNPSGGYHIVPINDEVYHDSLEAPLLTSGSPISRPYPSNLRSITISFGLVFRFFPSLLALISFIFLVSDGPVVFIGADILLMMIVVLNIGAVIHSAITHVFRITIEVRQRPRKTYFKPILRVRRIIFLDVGLSAIALICLLVGHLSTRNQRWVNTEAGAILGYIAVAFQMFGVVSFDGTKLTLATRLERTKNDRASLSFHGPDEAGEEEAAMTGARSVHSNDDNDDVDADARRISGENLV